MLPSFQRFSEGLSFDPELCLESFLQSAMRVSVKLSRHPHAPQALQRTNIQNPSVNGLRRFLEVLPSQAVYHDSLATGWNEEGIL